MRNFVSGAAVLWVAAIMMTACDAEISRAVPTRPSLLAPVPEPPVRPLVREIQLNEIVEEDIERRGIECMTRHGFTVPCRQYQLTAPAAGTLLATLSWDSDYTGCRCCSKLMRSSSRKADHRGRRSRLA
jgi:hypothetical protein